MKKVFRVAEGFGGPEIEKVQMVEKLNSRSEVKTFLEQEFPGEEFQYLVDELVLFFSGKEKMEPWSEEFWENVISRNPEGEIRFICAGEERSYWVVDPQEVEGMEDVELEEKYVEEAMQC